MDPPTPRTMRDARKWNNAKFSDQEEDQDSSAFSSDEDSSNPPPPPPAQERKKRHHKSSQRRKPDRDQHRIWIERFCVVSALCLLVCMLLFLTEPSFVMEVGHSDVVAPNLSYQKIGIVSGFSGILLFIGDFMADFLQEH